MDRFNPPIRHSAPSLSQHWNRKIRPLLWATHSFKLIEKHDEDKDKLIQDPKYQIHIRIVSICIFLRIIYRHEFLIMIHLHG